MPVSTIEKIMANRVRIRIAIQGDVLDAGQ